MSRRLFALAFSAGLVALAWVGLGFLGSNALALAMTAAIAAVYLVGAFELKQYRAQTAGLASALSEVPQPLARLADWLERVPPALREPVRLRVEAGRGGLPGPSLTPYLVGLLVMLGMLGTFLGMVVTFRGAVFALEGSTDLQAVRAALAAPIRGLGLAFGTSVAGVAASAMLGLMSALSRRDRLQVARELERRIGAELRPFSPARQREESLQALQSQAGALPAVVDRLDALMARIEQRSQALDEQLLQRQARFQGEARQAYTELAQSVAAALQDSLAAGARAAGDSITPVVESAMARIARESEHLHQRLGAAAQAQVDAISQQFSGTAQELSRTWSAALHAHARTSEELAARLQQSLGAFNQGFEQGSAALLAQVNQQATRSQENQARHEQQRLQAWTEALQAASDHMTRRWQQAGEHTAVQQEAVCASLEQAAARITESTRVQAQRTLDEASRLLQASQELVCARTEAEAGWIERQDRRMDEMATLWRTELAALRQEEGERGRAAVDRLGELQAAVAQHLASLGSALEAPMSRLLQTAAEVPQAAAGVVAQVREQMSAMAERDNLALQERTALLEQLGALMQSVNQAAGDQRAATEALLESASSVLAQAGERFASGAQAQAREAADMAAQVGASALELASLGEAFGHGVQLFQSASDKLLETLQRIESAMTRSTTRSDEQLAYYVAQAREVIDLSIASQQGLVDHLRQLQVHKPLALADETQE